MAAVRDVGNAAAPPSGNGHRGRISIADFCREPHRSAVINRFPGFPRADVEDAFSFAMEKGLQNLCREESEASIGAWLHKVMLRRLMRVSGCQQLVQPGGGHELDRFATQRLSPEQQVVRDEHCREIAEFVDALPARTAGVLRARYFDELSRGQVAETLNLSEKQVKRELENAMDALQAFVAERAGSEPCDFGRKAVTVHARGWAQGAVASQARHHLTKCEQCRQFYGDFRSLRWGAAATIPAPLVASAPDHVALADRVVAAADWVKQRAYSISGQTDPSALGALRPGSAATIATCVAIGTAGGASYCITQGVPAPVRELLPGSHEQVSGKERPDQAEAVDVAAPTAGAPAPAATTIAPTASPAPSPEPPAPEPEPQPQEFNFERTASTDSSGSTSTAAASASPSPTQSEPSEPAPAPTSGGGEFAP